MNQVQESKIKSITVSKARMPSSMKYGSNHYVNLNLLDKDHGEYKIGCAVNGCFDSVTKLYVGKTSDCAAAILLKEYIDQGIPVYYSDAAPCRRLLEIV